MMKGVVVPERRLLPVNEDEVNIDNRLPAVGEFEVQVVVISQQGLGK